MKAIKFACAAIGAAMFSCAANATTINFDGVAPVNSGVNLGPTYTVEGVTFSAPSPVATSNMRVFNSPSAGSYLLSCDFTTGGNPCDEDMLMDFGGAVTATSLISYADDNAGIGGSISAFLGGALVGSVDIITNGVGFDGDLVVLSGLGVFDTLLFVNSDVAGLGFTNIIFERVGDVDDNVVPLPAALPMLLTGVAGLSFLQRRRKKHSA